MKRKRVSIFYSSYHEKKQTEFSIIYKNLKENILLLAIMSALLLCVMKLGCFRYKNDNCIIFPFWCSVWKTEY